MRMHVNIKNANKLSIGRIVIILQIISIISLKAQDPHVPTILPPTPEAYSITRFIDMPNDYFTGRFSKNIPIYEVKEGDLSLPISLSYSTGGFKVQEDAGWVGLGWNLNAGGVIARTVMGGADDWEGNPLGGRGFLEMLRQYDTVAEPYGGIYEYLVNGPNDTQRFNLLQLIAQGCYDSQPDLFSFNFNGISGTFNFNWESHEAYDSSNPTPLVTIDSKYDLKVEAHWSDPVNNKGFVNGWTIIAPDGFTYKFEAIESTEIVSTSVSGCFFGSNQNYNSAWYLTEISNVFGGRKIYIDYQSYTHNNRNIALSHSKTYTLGGSSSNWCGLSSPSINKNSANTNIYGVRPSRIYSSHSNIEVSFGNNPDKLEEILIKEGSIEKFKWDLTISDNLDAISQVGGNQTNNSYSFEYHPNNYSWDAITDHWGYANDGGASGSGQIPSHTVLDYNGNKLTYSGGVSKNPSYSGSVAGAMKKIIYPTGGSEIIEYELNKIGYVGYELTNNHVFDNSITQADLENISLIEIDEYATEAISIYGISIGQQNQSGGSCSSTVGDIVNEYPFSVLASPDNPSDSILVTIIPDIEYYVEDGDPYFGGGFAPKVEILDSQGSVIQTLSEQDDNETRYFELVTGNYKMRTTARFKDCNGNYDKASATLSYENYTGNTLYEKPVGGVRIKSIEKLDENDNVLLKQSYSYQREDGYSSGVLSSNPTYVNYYYYYVDTGGTGEAYCYGATASNSPTFSGRHHGYSRVTVTNDDGNMGKTIYQFLVKPDDVFKTTPYQSPNSNNGLNGLLIKKEVLNSSNVAIYEENMEYGYNEEKTNAFKVNFQGGIQFHDYKFDIGTYRVNNDHASPVSVIKKFLDSGLETKEETHYDSNIRKVTSTVTHSSDEIIKQQNFYVEDYPVKTLAIQNLEDNHQTGIPIETVTTISDGSQEFIRSGIYRAFEGGVLDEVYVLNTSSDLLSSQFNYSVNNSGQMSSNYESLPEVQINYDSNGNIVSVDKRGDITVHVWGYGRTYPVISLKNASESQVNSILTASDNSMLDNTPSKSQLVELRNRLANQLPDAIVNGYVYDEVFGVTTTIDQNGLETNYEYDGLGRLIFVRDHNGNLLKQITYQIKN